MNDNKYLKNAVELVHKWNMCPYPWKVTLIAIKSILADLHINKEYSEQLPVWSQPLSSDDYSTLTEYEQNTLNSTEACRHADLSIRLRKRKFNQIYKGLKAIKKLARLTDDTATIIAILGIIKDISEIANITDYGARVYDIRI